jgi:two-component system nitrate/nitrite response regulator NarL
MISVLVIDDHPVVADGVATILRASRAHVVSRAATISQAAGVLPQLRPDIVLLDLRLGDDELSVSGVPRLRAASPNSKIVIFTAFPEHPAVDSAIAAGAVGFLVKDTGRTDLVSALIAVADGGRLPERSPTARRTSSHADLSAREYEILVRVSMGETNAEIARELILAQNTVKTYWQNVLEKLRARNRADAIAKAYRAGLLL